MRERELRQTIEALCGSLDRRRRQAARGLKKVALPLMFGAGLALSAGGCGDRAVAPKADLGAEADARPDRGSECINGACGTPLYGVP